MPSTTVSQRTQTKPSLYDSTVKQCLTSVNCDTRFYANNFQSILICLKNSHESKEVTFSLIFIFDSHTFVSFADFNLCVFDQNLKRLDEKGTSKTSCICCVTMQMWASPVPTPLHLSFSTVVKTQRVWAKAKATVGLAFSSAIKPHVTKDVLLSHYCFLAFFKMFLCV